MCSGSSGLRLTDSGITHLKAHRPSRTCNESKGEEEEEEEGAAGSYLRLIDFVYHSRLESNTEGSKRHLDFEELDGVEDRIGAVSRHRQPQQVPHLYYQGRCKATWKTEFKLPWREAGPPNHLNSDQ
jgi:hypothetical protein